MRKRKTVRPFKGIDELGAEIDLEVHRESFRYHSNKGASSSGGNFEIKTSDGDHVEHIGPGRYRIVEDGMEITSTDPNQPTWDG